MVTCRASHALLLTRAAPRTQAAPKPFNLPSLRKEYGGGQGQSVSIVPTMGPVWGEKASGMNDTTAAAAAAVAESRMAAKSRAEAAVRAAQEAMLEEEAAASTAQKLLAVYVKNLRRCQC